MAAGTNRDVSVLAIAPVRWRVPLTATFERHFKRCLATERKKEAPDGETGRLGFSDLLP